jgi:hypothetical protein
MTMTPERMIELYNAARSEQSREGCWSTCECVLCSLKYAELLDLLQPHARGIEAMIEREVAK